MLILISLQSCFTYKSVNYNSMINEKNKKIKVTKIDKTNIKGRLISVNKKSMVLEKKGENQTIVKDEINEVKIRKFSYLKTLRFIGLGLIRTIFR